MAYFSLRSRLALEAGLEPATLWLTARCSTIELLQNSFISGDRLYGFI